MVATMAVLAAAAQARKRAAVEVRVLRVPRVLRERPANLTSCKSILKSILDAQPMKLISLRQGQCPRPWYHLHMDMLVAHLKLMGYTVVATDRQNKLINQHNM